MSTPTPPRSGAKHPEPLTLGRTYRGVVLLDVPESLDGKQMALVRCTCGARFRTRAYYLTRGTAGLRCSGCALSGRGAP